MQRTATERRPYLMHYLDSWVAGLGKSIKVGVYENICIRIANG